MTELQLELTDIAYGGNAFGRYDGRAIFVPYGLPGETVRVRIQQDKGRYAIAELVDILQPSPDRTTPPCPHFGPGRCGGCHWQHADYAAQLRYKQRIVADQLGRFGGYPDLPVRPTLPSPTPWRYRAHVTFHVAADGTPGFVATDDHTVIPIRECHIIQPELQELHQRLQVENLHGVKRLRLQVGSEPSDRLIAFSADRPPKLTQPVEASLSLLGSNEDTRPLTGDGRVRYRIHDHWYQVSAGSFFQVNPDQARMLVDLTLDRLNLQGAEFVLELFSGVGLFTTFLAERAASVTAIESFPPAVMDAAHNLDGFSNVRLIQGSVEQALNKVKGSVSAAVIDPPRSGMTEKALVALAAREPRIIVYISCDPSTLARDAKRLRTLGYTLEDAQPVDMFPQTHHIETVATFRRER